MNMKYTILLAVLLLTGCGKVADTFTTLADGYVIKCIEGTRFVLMSSDSGLAITPLVDTEGRPKACTN
jgi:hypothetical protein